VRYSLERSTNLVGSPAFRLLATHLPGQMDTNFSGQAGATTYTDTNAAAAPRLFYRIGVP
jgi:hypothetical protein